MIALNHFNTTTYRFVMIAISLCAVSILPSGAAEDSVAELPRALRLAQIAPESEAYRALSPMHRELADILRAERQQLAELGEQFKAATSSLESLKIQKKISKAKTQTELTLLGVQLRYARAAGEGQVVKELETAIESMQRPQLTKPAVARER